MIGSVFQNMLNKKEQGINNACSFIYVCVIFVLGGRRNIGTIHQKLMKIVTYR